MSNPHFESGVTLARMTLCEKRVELEKLLEEARRDVKWKSGREQEEARGRVEIFVEALTNWPKLVERPVRR